MGENIINKQIFGGDCVIDFIKAVKRPFSDFRKFGLGFLFGLVPIVNFFVGGYSSVILKVGIVVSTNYKFDSGTCGRNGGDDFS